MSNKKTSTGTACAVAILMMLLVPVLSLYSAFAYGFVLAKLWAWYAVPLGAASLGWKTFGAGSLAFWLLRGNPLSEGDEKTRLAHGIGLSIAPWLTLLWGYWLL